MPKKCCKVCDHWHHRTQACKPGPRVRRRKPRAELLPPAVQAELERRIEKYAGLAAARKPLFD